MQDRAPGTDAERRLANLMAQRLVALGRDAEIQAINVHRSPEAVQALHAFLGIVASIISVYLSPVGFALLLLVTASCYLDLSSRAYLLRRLLFRRGSQNVISRGGRPDAPERLLLAAGCDAPRTGWIKGARAWEMRRRLPLWLRRWAGIYRVLLWGGLVPLIPIIGARLAGIDTTWLTVIQTFPTVLLALLVFALIDSAIAPPGPGADENGSGMAACLEIGARLAARPCENLDVWIVLTGGSTCFGEGMRALLSDPALGDRQRPTSVIEFSSVGAGTPSYRSLQGAGFGVQPSDRLVHPTGLTGVKEPVSGDAVAAHSAGADALTITGTDDGIAQPWRSTMADLPERLDARTISASVDAAERVARTLDAEWASGSREAVQAEGR